MYKAHKAHMMYTHHAPNISLSYIRLMSRRINVV